MKTKIPTYILFVMMAIVLVLLSNLISSFRYEAIVIVSLFFTFILVCVIREIYHYFYLKNTLIERKFYYQRFLAFLLISILFFIPKVSPSNPMVWLLPKFTWLGIAFVLWGIFVSFHFIVFKKDGFKQSGLFSKILYSDLTFFDLSMKSFSYTLRNGDNVFVKIIEPHSQTIEIIQNRIQRNPESAVKSRV